MSPRHYTPQSNTSVGISSPYAASPSLRTSQYQASPNMTMSLASDPESILSTHRSPVARGGYSSSQREAMLGGSLSGWSVRAVTELGCGTGNGLISQMVTEVPQTPENISRITSKTVPLPSQNGGHGRVEVDLNPALKFDHRREERGMVPMDVAMSIDAILRMTNSSRGPSEWATNPPLPSINLVHPTLPWSITVHASVTYVTVCDVLCTICHSLQLPLHEQFWSFCVGLGEGYRRNPEQYGRTLKRLHLLHGKTTFVGLSRTVAETALGGDIWRMNFA
ncbi:hypothetical protein EV359DRAFT_77114 [Lentinula novae-zelandiae]|nr:hypothetical protein EV359DRAFT_77114 [Lentinula novae-zelandiae]